MLSFFPYSLFWSSKRNRPIRVVKCHKFSEPSLNVADYVAAYLNRTLQFRLRAVSLGLPKPRSLFLSYHTGKPVRTSTLSRYILTTMQLAGINTEVFKAHSARGTFPSLMKRKGASASIIMQQGDWRNCSTFERYYCRESEDSVAGKLIREVIGKSKSWVFLFSWHSHFCISLVFFYIFSMYCCVLPLPLKVY